MEEDIVDLIQEIESTQQESTNTDLVVTRSQWIRLIRVADKLKERMLFYRYMSNAHIGAHATTHRYPDAPKPMEPTSVPEDPEMKSRVTSWWHEKSLKAQWPGTKVNPSSATQKLNYFMGGFLVASAVIVVASIVVTAVMG